MSHAFEKARAQICRLHGAAVVLTFSALLRRQTPAHSRGFLSSHQDITRLHRRSCVSINTIFRCDIQPRGTTVSRAGDCTKNSGQPALGRPMASSEPGRSSGHGEETTQPPEGMYWVQMQGLWALRPIVDLDYNRVRANASQPTERAVGSTLAQQRVSLSDADRQWLSQSAGAACSAAALTEASALPEGEGNSRLERLPRTQGVIEFRHQHCSPSFAAAVAHDTTPRVQPQPLTSPPPLPLPAPPPQQVPEQQHQVWPDWLLQWGRRVEDEEGSGHAPGPSAPPSAPTSPPEKPQRSIVKKCLSQHAKVCHTHSS